MNSTFKKTLLASLVVPFALGAQSASAAMITSWDYGVKSQIDLVDVRPGTGSVDSVASGRKLEWGTRDAKSSISITDVSSDPLDPSGVKLITNNGYVTGGTFTHTNNVIRAGDEALSKFNLSSDLKLTSISPAGSSIEDSATFNSFFVETLNNGNCVAASTSNCDDIFTIFNIADLGASKTDDGWYEFASDPFNIDGYKYTVYLELAGLSVLDGDACTAVGASAGCVGLLTKEDAVNNFETRFRITGTAHSVPEPGTLALLGLGLAGLGVSRRRKAAK